MIDFELIGVITGLLCVYLTVKENVWCWPTGIICSICYIIVFYNTTLYGQAVLQVFFIIVSIYGWYHWLHGGKDKTPLEVSRLTPAQWGLFSGLSLLFTLIFGFGLYHFAGEEVGYLDAVITGLSFIAQYLLARKKLESWLGWITVDVLSVGMFAYTGLYKTSLLYTAFLILASRGFFEWKKKLQKQRA